MRKGCESQVRRFKLCNQIIASSHRLLRLGKRQDFTSGEQFLCMEVLGRCDMNCVQTMIVAAHMRTLRASKTSRCEILCSCT